MGVLPDEPQWLREIEIKPFVRISDMGIISSQFDAREEMDRVNLRKAYETLAESVSGVEIFRRLGTDDLERADGAIRACLRYCGASPGETPEEYSDLMERINYMCGHTGVMHRTVRLEKGWCKDAFGAMLGQLKTGEVVALLPRGRKGYAYRKPDTGEIVKIKKSTEELFESSAELFYPTFPARKMDRSDLLKFILRRLDYSDFVLVIGSSVVTMLVGLLPAYATSLAYGRVIPLGMMRLILPVLALLLGVAVSTLLLKMNQNLVMNRIAIKLSNYTEAASFARILTLPTSFFRNYSAGNLASRQARMVNVVESGVQIVLGVGLSLLLSIVYLIQIAYFAPSLVVPAFLIVAVQCLVIFMYLKLTQKYENRTMHADSAVSGTTTGLIKGMQKIRLAGAEDRAFSIWAKKYAAYAEAMYQRPRYLYCVEAVIAVIGMLGTVLIYYNALGGKVTVDRFMAFNTSFGQINAIIISITALLGTIVKIIPSMELVDPILEAEPEVHDERPVVKDIRGTITLNNVSFRYSPDMPWILKDISLNIKQGEYVGIVGHSGCGKSTLMRLLLGFETPEFGSIMFGDYDIREINVGDLRSKAMAVVLQDAKLLKGDIFHNIILSKPDATLEDAWEAAEIAGIADDIRKMPMGMNTLVSEGGGGISGGQRQRLIIARAVCTKRKIMLMDEATSALDNITQMKVADSLAKLQCTRIVVAHRLSTVRHCDRILVIEQGEIAEAGTYEELIEKNGVFAELVRRQRLEEA